MDAGALDLLHDAGHEVIGAVADGVDLDTSVPMMYLSISTGWLMSTCLVMTPMYSMTSAEL